MVLQGRNRRELANRDGMGWRLWYTLDHKEAESA
jgi:hypothetical protein